MNVLNKTNNFKCSNLYALVVGWALSFYGWQKENRLTNCYTKEKDGYKYLIDLADLQQNWCGLVFISDGFNSLVFCIGDFEQRFSDIYQIAEMLNDLCEAI